MPGRKTDRTKKTGEMRARANNPQSFQVNKASVKMAAYSEWGRQFQKPLK